MRIQAFILFLYTTPHPFLAVLHQICILSDRIGSFRRNNTMRLHHWYLIDVSAVASSRASRRDRHTDYTIGIFQWRIRGYSGYLLSLSNRGRQEYAWDTRRNGIFSYRLWNAYWRPYGAGRVLNSSTGSNKSLNFMGLWMFGGISTRSFLVFSTSWFAFSWLAVTFWSGHKSTTLHIY